MRDRVRRSIHWTGLVLLLTVLANFAGAVLGLGSHDDSAVAVGPSYSAGFDALERAVSPAQGNHEDGRCLFCDAATTAGLPIASGVDIAPTESFLRHGTTPHDLLTSIAEPRRSARAPPLT